MLEKTKALAFRHKFISAIILVVLIAVVYFGYGMIFAKKAATTYVTAAASKGTITTSVSGSGQVAPSNQISIKPEVSGKLVYINTQTGQNVPAGTLLAEIDPRDAQKTVDSAENDLANAQLSTTDVRGTATDALNASYDSGLNALTTTFKDLATIKTNLDTTFEQSSYGGTDSDMNYYLKFVQFYAGNSSDLSFWNNDAKIKYDGLQTDLSATEQQGLRLGKDSLSDQIDKSINDTYTSTETFLDLIRRAFNLTQEYQNALSSKSLTTPIKLTTTTTQITNLSAAVSSLSTDTTALLAAKNDIAAKKQAVAQVPTSVQSQNLNIQQYQNALSDAKDTLAKYFIDAPFDGTIASLTSGINIGDDISSGTVLGSFITNQDIVQASFNEVDAVKIQLGQKAVVTFDALPNTSDTGKVVSIDTVSTTTQGVVTYGVKVALATDDNSIKPGMSATLNIITNVKQDVLTVPNSAVKTQGTTKYVQILVNGLPQNKAVTVGLSNTTSTEIVLGLNEGDKVVTQTIKGGSSTSSARTTTGAASTVRIPGLTGGGGFGGGTRGGL